MCNSIIILTENWVESSYGRVIYERTDLLKLSDDDLCDIYIITGHRQSLRVCMHVQCTFTVIVTVQYTVQWRWVGCCCRCACQWRDRSCCTVPVCTTTLFQILCQNVQCAVCAVPSPLAHKWKTGTGWSVIVYRCVSDHRWGYDDDRGHLRDTDRHKIEWGEGEERSSSIMRRWGDSSW